MRMWIRLEMHEYIPQGWEQLQQSILDPMSDSMPLINSERRIDFDVDTGEVFQAGLADPKCPTSRTPETFNAIERPSRTNSSPA